MKKRVGRGRPAALRRRAASRRRRLRPPRRPALARGRGELPRPDRGGAAHAARVRQDARRDREGQGQVGRRPEEGADGRGEEEARRRGQGRQADAGAGRRPADADDGAPRRRRQRHRRPSRLRRSPRLRHGRPGMGGLPPGAVRSRPASSPRARRRRRYAHVGGAGRAARPSRGHISGRRGCR